MAGVVFLSVFWVLAALAKGTAWAGFYCVIHHHPTSRNKQETDGSRHSTAPPGAKTALCSLVFRNVRRILLRLRQKISSIEAKERKLWPFEEGQSISSLESRQHGPDQSHKLLDLAVSKWRFQWGVPNFRIFSSLRMRADLNNFWWTWEPTRRTFGKFCAFFF